MDLPVEIAMDSDGHPRCSATCRSIPWKPMECPWKPVECPRLPVDCRGNSRGMPWRPMGTAAVLRQKDKECTSRGCAPRLLWGVRSLSTINRHTKKSLPCPYTGLGIPLVRRGLRSASIRHTPSHYEMLRIVILFFFREKLKKSCDS